MENKVAYYEIKDIGVYYENFFNNMKIYFMLLKMNIIVNR